MSKYFYKVLKNQHENVYFQKSFRLLLMCVVNTWIHLVMGDIEIFK